MTAISPSVAGRPGATLAYAQGSSRPRCSKSKGGSMGSCCPGFCPSYDPMYVSLLDDRGQGLLRGATRLQESREVRALAQLRDRELDPTDPCLPATLPVAVPVIGPIRAPHPSRSPGEPVDLGLHQPLARISQQLANQVRIGTLLEQLQQRHSLVGHRRLRWVPGLATRTFTEDGRCPP